MNRRQLGQELLQAVPLASAATLAACSRGSAHLPPSADERPSNEQSHALPEDVAASKDKLDRGPISLEHIDPSEIRTLIPRDAIQAIFRPEFMTIAEAQRLEVMRDDEPVLAIGHQNTWHAYSLLQLVNHEIVNDMVAGLPIAVAW